MGQLLNLIAVVDAVMTKGVTESPEFAYYVGHKEPFFDKINRIFRMFYLLLLSCLSYKSCLIHNLTVFSISCLAFSNCCLLGMVSPLDINMNCSPKYFRNTA